MRKSVPERGTRAIIAGLAMAIVAIVPPAGGMELEPKHGIAMHGEPLYPADFTHLSYVNPDAPEGGRMTFGVIGSFDSVNPLVVRGAPARGVRDLSLESLMGRSFDEPFSLYGLLAETIAVSDDRSIVEFKLRSEARFSDGTPVTAQDVAFTHALLRDHGRQNHRTFYSKVSNVEIVDPRTIRFTIGPEVDREMPLILGLMPILPEHATDIDAFKAGGLTPLVGSGPYVIDAVDPGGSILYRRDPDYWGADLALRRGMHNFDEVRYEYYRDGNTLFEAFKRGLYDVRPEDDPTRWATQYDFPALESGEIVLDEFELGVPRGMSAFAFNTRRPLFEDVRVRQALIKLFDFEWINRTLYHDLYARTASYYEASELSSRGRPASDTERALLGPWMDYVDGDILEGRYELPVSDGSGRDRTNMREALALLRAAGYELDQGVLRSPVDGAAVEFEFLAATSEQERLALAYQRALDRVGIDMSVRLVDSAQFQRRLTDYDFDMIQYHWFASLSPGNEQLFYWGSDAAGQEGTRNYAGIRNPAVDAMIAALLEARSREDFVAAARALDRVLRSGHYVVPLFHLPRQWLARRADIGRPETTSLYGYILETWWRVP